MKLTQIIPILLIIIGCSIEDKNDHLKKLKLVEGTFYLNKKKSNDTLRFQIEKFDKGDWNNTIWRITKDSIFETDNRGLSYYLGKDQRKYKLKNDTLFILNNTKNWKNEMKRSEENSIEKYLLLISNKKQLEIIDLNKNKTINTNHDIRTDIQLR